MKPMKTTSKEIKGKKANTTLGCAQERFTILELDLGSVPHHLAPERYVMIF